MLAKKMWITSLRQALEKSLRKFVHWFMIEMVQVESNNHRDAIVAFRKTLPLGSSLVKPFTKSNLTTIWELPTKTNKYANMEEELRVANNKCKITLIGKTQPWLEQNKKGSSLNLKRSYIEGSMKVLDNELKICSTYKL